MKIIKHGVVPKAKPPWQIGHEFSCHHCNCRFVIEDGDQFNTITERRIGGLSEFEIVCPECGTLLTFPARSEASLKPMWVLG